MFNKIQKRLLWAYQTWRNSYMINRIQARRDFLSLEQGWRICLHQRARFSQKNWMRSLACQQIILFRLPQRGVGVANLRKKQKISNSSTSRNIWKRPEKIKIVKLYCPYVIGYIENSMTNFTNHYEF